MSHLKTLLTGKARAAIASMGYPGDLYGEVWALLERRFGRPYLIVEAQLNTLRNQQAIRMHDSKALVSYSTTISKVVSVLKHYKYEGDLRSSATQQIATEKLPPNLKEKWWFYVDETSEDRTDLCPLENWLSRLSFVYEGMSQPTGERKEDHRRNANKTKQFSKSSNFSSSSNVKEAQATISDHCPLSDGTHKILNCPLFKNMNVNDRYAAVRKQRLCYGCLGKGHAIKDCKVNACGINGCTKKHSRLLHSENQMVEGNHAVNVSAEGNQSK